MRTTQRRGWYCLNSKRNNKMGTIEQEYRERKDAFLRKHVRKLLYSTGCGIVTAAIGSTFVLPPWLVSTGCIFGFLFGAEACMYFQNHLT